MSYPFEVGKTYRNRTGEYIVQAIDGERMTIRYVNGGTLETGVAIQARIWENIHFEEQMVREEEKRRLAQEARVEARKRQARARKARSEPKYEGFQEGDFEYRQRGIAWSGREQAGKALAFQLGQRTTGQFGSWIVPRQPEVHVARKDQYDLDRPETNAAFFVAVDETGVTHGFRTGKPAGSEKDTWPWLLLMAALADDQAVRRALRAAMKDQDLVMDVYVEERSYQQVGRILLQERGFLWQYETEDQEVAQKMDWNQLVEQLEDVTDQKRSALLVCRQLAPEDALKLGEAATTEACDVFEALLPLYDASIGA